MFTFKSPKGKSLYFNPGEIMGTRDRLELVFREAFKNFWDRKFFSYPITHPDISETPLFYAPVKLSELEKMELKFLINYYFSERGFKVPDEEIHVLPMVDKERPHQYCYAILCSRVPG